MDLYELSANVLANRRNRFVHRQRTITSDACARNLCAIDSSGLKGDLKACADFPNPPAGWVERTLAFGTLNRSGTANYSSACRSTVKPRVRRSVVKVLHCLVVAMSLCAANVYAQGNHAHPSAAADNAESSQGAHANQEFGRVEHQKPVEKKEECVGPVSFCNIYFGS